MTPYQGSPGSRKDVRPIPPDAATNSSDANRPLAKPPLQGVRVVDFGQNIFAPWAAQMLAILGAEVIKVESRATVDTARGYAPFADDVQTENTSALFNNLNLSKKSCTINLKHPAGVRLAKRLVKLSDVVIENFSVGVIERLGLGYQVLRRLKPKIIMVSCSFVGQTGPHKNHKCYGNTAQAYSSLTALTGYLDGQPRGLGGTWADPVGGEFAALAILAALHYRQKTGRGQFIDVSMTEAILSMLPDPLMDYAASGRNKTCMGNRDEVMAPHGVYRCLGEDRWVAIAVPTDTEWNLLRHAMGDPAWAAEARFVSADSRLANQDELDSLLSTWTLGRADAELMETLQHCGVPAGPCFDQQALLDNPHLRERRLFLEIDHPAAGRRQALRLPWCTSDASPAVYTPAPLLGQHNEYVFHELLGLATRKIAALTDEGVIL